jgi:hypothetical protein
VKTRIIVGVATFSTLTHYGSLPVLVPLWKLSDRHRFS